MYKYADIEYKGVKFHVALSVADNNCGYKIDSIYLSDSVNLLDFFNKLFEFNDKSAAAAIKRLAVDNAHF